MSDRHLADAVPGEQPTHGDVQQLIEAERGRGTQGVRRSWQASNSTKVVLTSDATGVKISADDGTTAPSKVLVESRLPELLPPGTIQAYVGALSPAGWWVCNGQAISRATSPLLFALIGITYGAGDGSTTFNLPNLQGRVILGVSGTHPLSTGGGSETGPAHTHPGSHSHGQNSHTHGQNSHTHGQNGHVHDLTGHNHGLNGHTHTTNLNHGHGGSAGGGTGTTDHVLVGAVTDPNHVRDTHAHTITVNGTGTLNVDSAVSATANTATSGSINTGTPSSPDTQGPSNPNTQGPSNSATETDATAPAAAYGGAVLPPFLVLTWIIRNG